MAAFLEVINAEMKQEVEDQCNISEVPQTLKVKRELDFYPLKVLWWVHQWPVLKMIISAS